MKRGLTIALVVILFVLVLSSCSPAKGKISSATGKISSPPPTIKPISTLSSSQLEEQMKNQKPGKCLILDDMFYEKIKIIDKGGEKVAVANLPKGTVLFSPVSGRYNNTIVEHWPEEKKDVWDFGAMVSADDTNSVDYKFGHDFNFTYLKASERKVSGGDGKGENFIKKGDQIGIIDNGELKHYSGYNLCFSISQSSKIDNELLLKIFPDK